MMTVNNTVAAMVSGTYARVPEHTGKTTSNTVNYRVVNRPVQVERPVMQENRTELTIENQFEIYI